MKLLTPTAIAAALITGVTAHSITGFVKINGQQMGNSFIRLVANNNPVKDLTSPDMLCNVGGSNPASSWLPVQAGTTFTVEWRYVPISADQDLGENTPPDGVIAGSHKGPLCTYIAEACSNGEGPVWYKIQEDGYTDGSWATDKLRDRHGDYNVTVPKNLAGGFYIFRAELIAYHEGDVSYLTDPKRGIQVYIGCIQIEVQSTGTETLPAQGGVSFPGAYSYDSPDVVFNIYNTDPTTFNPPGPALTIL